ncbi:MAG: DNA primase [Microbacterium sp.]|uniref:DNA primase n=1 Tax=Microbacterium ginsengisoli TaxID=400772 RepID=A0A0F0LVW5_9MICO|nr:DNA primase [Microbacterium ginsengisoli]KJL37833.1 DNA primase [Microbacterium ginsengisoli]MAL07222.1 DNA primase [Microbacterium sp.]MBN9208806.1 DNA primase [Microbacterium ginsengisoli]HAN24442.1 DNA primase [Microbacterium ginsengisoli]
MPGRIVQTDVDEVKSRTNIADIVGERVALKPAGVGSLKGLCPFHDERSPSFHVRPQHGFYHCFGCGASGDVYTFLREMDHLSFTESVERLAGRLGYALHYEDGGPAVETSGRTRLYAAGAAAAVYFREQLQSAEAETARAFLGGRGFDAGAAAHFGVGYAPKGWGNLQQALRAQGFSDEELLTAGLLSQGQRGVYDRFRGRVVWPIRDVTGQVVGFGARKLYDDDQGPKYLNTPETPIYRKSQVLYGLDLAKKDISRSRQVVVVEGYTDVMACHLAGITTAVATCGTAFGSEHITALRRVMGDDSAHGEVVFTFDPDDAGVGAAMRAFADEKRFAAQTYVAVAPPGLDPCDLRLARGDGAVRAIIESKVPMFEFAIDQRIRGFDLGTVEGRAGALRAGAPIVAGIRDPSLQPGYVKVLARRLGLELGEVSGAVRRASRSVGAQREQEEIPHSAETPSELRITLQTLPTTADAALERDALMGFLQYGHLIDGELVRRALDTTFTVPGLDAVRGVVAAMPDYSHPGWAAAAVQAVREPYRSLAAELLTGTFPARDALHAQLSAQDLARRLSLRTLDRTKSELLGAMQRVPADSDEGRAVRLRLRDLDVERQRLLDAG